MALRRRTPGCGGALGRRRAARQTLAGRVIGGYGFGGYGFGGVLQDDR